jgi:3-oxoacyl-(acyl-carrier-protein) synthase
MNKRVVITGLGVVAPNGTGIPDFLEAIQNGTSGIRFNPQYEALNFNCQVSGVPDFEWDHLKTYVNEVTFHGLKGQGIGYAIIAALDAWNDAGNELDYDSDTVLWDTGCVFGNSVSDTVVIKNIIARVDAKEARKLGSRVIEQVMNSGATAYISGRLGLGNKVITNSAACATGSQAVLMGYEYIKFGMAKRMLVGSTEHVDPYIFGAFDSMRVLSRKFNQFPEQASRPMSASSGGFVPGSGAGAMVLEDLDFALARGASIYAEILGGANNSGGQRNGGSMTAPNNGSVIKCLEEAVINAQVQAQDIDLISGHLTGTMADKMEVANWMAIYGKNYNKFPLTNSLKSMIGHCLSAAGSIECVAVALQLFHQFVHPNINLEDPNPEIAEMIGMDALPTGCLKKEINIAAKANFGFGDINTCLIFSKFDYNG